MSGAQEVGARALMAAGAAVGAGQRVLGVVQAPAVQQPLVVAAETAADPADLRERGRRKRRRKGVDLLAVNEVGWSKGFESADNAVILIDADDEVVASPSGSKREVADALWDAVLVARSR